MHETEDIKSRLPIEQVVGGYLPLKKAGRIFKANCPFHNESTPSFTVSPERGIFKCFGCGEGGDIFDFVMKIEGLSFRETLELLAERAGVELKEQKPQDKVRSGPGKTRLLALNQYAAKLWHTLLTKHPSAQVARDYIQSRGLTSESIDTFQIGYAPLGQASLGALKKAGFTAEELQAAGEPSRFQDRITFPITDITGNVIGFTGRLLETGEDPKQAKNRGPKYWNTPETLLFIKSRALYALHLAKRNIQQEDVSILAEGQMDVVMLHQAGFTNTVASSGTALTTEQVKLLGRFSENIAFAYDQDKAGIEATKRGIELVLAAGFNPLVIVIPDGKDPADVIKKDPELFKEAYINRLPAMQWLIEQTIREHPDLTPVSKKQIVQTLLPWLSKITDSVETGEWIQWIATRIQTDTANIHTALSRSSQPITARTEDTPSEKTENKQFNLGEIAAAILLSFPGLMQTVSDQVASLRLAPQTTFLEEALQIFETTGDLATNLKNLPDQQRKSLSLKLQDILHAYDEDDLDELWGLQEFMVITQRIRSDAKEGTKQRLASEIRLAQQAGDTKRIGELFSELKNLI